MSNGPVEIAANQAKNEVRITVGKVAQGGNHKTMVVSTIEAVLIVQKLQEKLGIK